MRDSERHIERNFSRDVNRRGGLALKFTSPGWRGAPDRIVLVPGGRIVFVEFKAPGKKPSLLQVRRHNDLRLLGFDVRVIDNVDDSRNLIDELFGGGAVDDFAE